MLTLGHHMGSQEARCGSGGASEVVAHDGRLGAPHCR